DEAPIVIAVPGHAYHEAPPILAGERHEQLSTSGQAIEPERSGVSGAGKRDDGVDLAGIVVTAVAMDDFDLRPRAKVVARLGGKLAVALDRNHTAPRPHDLGENGRVVAGAGADLQDPAAALPLEVVEIPAAALPVEVVETTRPKAGLAVVEPTCLI